MLWTVILYCLLSESKTILSLESNTTLQAVHVIFRHGEKTPDSLSAYPNDPNKNETYYPYGLGQLTKQGKQTIYQLGKYLQHRYKHFLKNAEVLDFLEAHSSDFDRTKTSLQLILAAMFPPRKEERLDKYLNWQPIPYSYSPRARDLLFLSVLACSNFNIEVQKTTNIFKYNAKKNSDFKLFKYISNNAGTTYNNYLQILALYDGLISQEQWGLHLPEWTKKIYPDDLTALALKGFESSFVTVEQKKIAGGYLLQKIIKDSLNRKKKMFLYSGHDFTLMALLHVLHLHNTLDSLPTFGETLLLELHNYNGTYGFKIFYKRNAKLIELKLLTIPRCDEFCSIEKFIALTKIYMPDGLKTCGFYTENHTNVLTHIEEDLNNHDISRSSPIKKYNNIYIFLTIVLFVFRF